jgi:nucleoside phosphorylase
MALADAKWALENLGFDPTAAKSAASVSQAPKSPQDFARDIIDFDSEGSAGRAFAAQATGAKPLSDMKPIPWPDGLAPTPVAKMGGSPTDSLAALGADVLIVTWTMDEGHALSRVLTPGFDSDRDWKAYTNNYTAIANRMRNGAPALAAQRLGTYWVTKIGDKRVLCFKSDSHLSQDGPASGGVVPNAIVWKQLIEQAKPSLVITTGTGGGIGAEVEVGDVVVSQYVRFDCQQEFKNAAFHNAEYRCTGSIKMTTFANAAHLFGPNAAFLPSSNSRAPKILTAASYPTGVVTTDFFGFDCTANTYHLRDPVEGRLSEMGDAVLGLVATELGAAAPPYAIVRNVSDPEIKSDGLSEEQQRNLAGDIYKAYGKWSTVCSAITCWALVAALQ